MVYSIFAFAFPLVALVGFIFRRQQRRILSSYSDILSLLDPPGSSIAHLLLARAEPNKRLVHAFQIHNAFVSADIGIRKQFISHVREILRRHTQNFRAFPDAARGVVAGVASRLTSHHRTTPFSRFVQVVTLRIVICHLLGGNIPEESDENVTFVVEAINELWIISKNCAHPMRSELLEHMSALLHRWLPAYERPLDFIIPAYETMWRVVAVTVARAVCDPDACAAFSAYLDSPLEKQFGRFKDERPSVEAFMCEIMRLHPPSRRLPRMVPSRFAGVPLWTRTVYVADLEALHRDMAVWGKDADAFDPMRFHQSRVSYEQRRAYIPFSCGPLRCVAFKEAPRVAAIVAAGILQLVCEPNAGYGLECGKQLGWREGWEGWSIKVATQSSY
jgi:Cytochrome P450